MTTGPASGFSWAVKRRKDPDNISTLTYYQPSSRSQLSETSAALAKNTFGLNLKPENESVYEIEGDNDDQIMEELPSEDKLSRTGKRHGSLDGSGLDFSQRGEGSPLKKNLVSNLVIIYAILCIKKNMCVNLNACDCCCCYRSIYSSENRAYQDR